jgi:hypothetical protein
LKARIWKDRWVPQPTTFMIQSPPNLLNPEATVSKLIDVDTHWWKTYLLENLFSEEEAKIILSLPISFTNREDVCIWKGSTSEKMFVRSTYYIQKKLENRIVAENSSAPLRDRRRSRETSGA